MTLPSGGRGPGGRWFPADNAERDAIITADGLELDDLCTVLSDGGEYICTDPAVSTWVPEATGGDVSGPGSSTDEAIARFDGATGKLLQDSGVTIDDSDNLTTPGNVFLDSVGGQLTVGDGLGTLPTVKLDGTGNTQLQFLQAGVTEILLQVGASGDLQLAADVSGSIKIATFRKASGNWEIPADLDLDSPNAISTVGDGLGSPEQIQNKSDAGAFLRRLQVAGVNRWVENFDSNENLRTDRYNAAGVFQDIASQVDVNGNTILDNDLRANDGVSGMGLTSSAGFTSLALTERAARVGAPTATRAEMWLDNETHHAWRVTTQDGNDHQTHWRESRFQTVNDGSAADTTLATLTANGDSVTLDVQITGVEVGGADVISRRAQITYYRTGGTVTALTAHLNDEQSAGAPVTATALVVSGNNINARITGDAAATHDWVLAWNRRLVGV